MLLKRAINLAEKLFEWCHGGSWEGPWRWMGGAMEVDGRGHGGGWEGPRR